MRSARLALLAFVCAAPAAQTQEPPAGGQTQVEKAVRTRPPRKGTFAPGELPEDEKRKKFDELSALAKKDPKAAARAASARRKERLESLERQFGIYDVATILDSGDSARRVDIVVVTAGFSKADAAKVNQMAESLKSGLLKVDPFHNYALYINIHRVNVNDGGPASARVPYRVVNNTLTCDATRALECAEQAPAADLVVVLCNTPPCRASASGTVITLDSSLDLNKAFLHEMGHAFGGLIDEYVEPGNEMKFRPQPFTPEQEESTPNVTGNGVAKFSKWHYWLPDLWNAAYGAHKLPAQHRVGCFEGAGLYGKGSFRPEDNCLMRTGDRYCVVCFEQVEKQFYRLIAPIDDARPRVSKLGLWSDDVATFEGDAIQTVGGAKSLGEFHGAWYVDRRVRRPTQAKNLTTSLTIPAAELGEGLHEVALRVDFSNVRVRRDHGWLSSARGWTVDVTRHSRPKFEGPAEVKAQVDRPVEFEIQVSNPDPTKFRLEAVDLPEGSTYVAGKFSWTPTKAHLGGWRPRFILTDGVRTVTKEIELAVLDSAEKTRYRPILPPMEPVGATAGETLELPLEAVDVDGDNLVFTCPNLPEGAELDPYQGVLRWKPGTGQIGRHPGIAYEVWDGIHRVKGAVEIVVEDNPILKRDPVDVLHQLRSPEAKSRAEALGRAGAYGKSFQFLEAARLLRDRSALVRGAALATLRSLAEGGDEALAAMMVKDLLPYAWSFTDDPGAMFWLGNIAAKGGGDKADVDALRLTLKAIEKYNRDRGVR